MGKMATKRIEHEGIVFEFPAEMGKPPSEEAERIVKSIQNPENWKYATACYYTYDKDLAESVAYCLDWYMGGHEMKIEQADRYGTLYAVSSRGYYAYVGA